MYSVTLQKILQLVGVGAFAGLILGIIFGNATLGVYTIFLSIITVLLAAMYAELYHIRDAINKQRTEQKDERERL